MGPRADARATPGPAGGSPPGALIAVHWFRRGEWLPAARLRLEPERVCNEAVLEPGARASDYCGHLVDIVRAAAWHRGVVVASAMAAAIAGLFFTTPSLLHW